MNSNSYTGADLFVDALAEYGVSHVFGNPGTTELPVLRALEGSELQYVMGLHEDIAVGMAGGYAATRRYHSHHDPAINPVGVVNLHIAPGLAHGLSNIQNASYTGAPLVVTAGDHSTSLRHEEPILSGDLVEMADQFCKWTGEVNDITALPTMIRRAFRRALSPPMGPVFLGLPMDVMQAETSDNPDPLGPIPSAGPGDRSQIEAAVSLLEDADEPLLVVGDHVARAGTDAIDAAVNLADKTGAAVYSEMITCEINFPRDHDQWVSVIPPNPEIANEVFDTDVILFAGCSTNTPYKPYDGDLIPQSATTIHVHEDPSELGKNQPVDVAIQGDPGEVMAEIAASTDVPSTDLEDRLEGIQPRKAHAAETIQTEKESRTDERISKPMLADGIRDVAPDGYIVNESITSKYALLTRWDLNPEQHIANKNGGLGYGLPATVGATIAMRQAGDDRPVIGFIGDGSYLYYPQSLYSAVRNGLDLTVVVPNNQNYRILKDGMIEFFGGDDSDHEYIGMDFEPPVDLVRNAESNGAKAARVSQAEDLERAISRAIRSDEPYVLDVEVTD